MRVRITRAREVAALAVLLIALTTLLYGSYVVDGGFLSDQWMMRSLYVFAPGDGIIDAYENTLDYPPHSPRPLNIAYSTVLMAIFGSHAELWLAWLALTCVLMSLSVYLLLREVDFEPLDAGTIAVLMLVFPATGSLRLWGLLVQLPLAMTLTALGLLLALRAFGAAGGRRWALHGVSLAMFVAALLLYEVVLPVMLASVLLYRVRVPWRPALLRWAVDCLVLIPLTLTVTRQPDSPWQTLGIAGTWDHGVVIFEKAQSIFTTSVLPFGVDRWYVLALAALIPASALLVAARLPVGDRSRGALRRWLGTLLAGLVVVALGYSIFAPSAIPYQPVAVGIGNRINAVPSIGWMIVLYSLIMLAVTLTLRWLGRSQRLASGIATLACLAIAVTWLAPLQREADAYRSAYSEGERVVSVLQRAAPHPPPNSAIWAFGQPVEIAPGVPIFHHWGDLSPRLQLMYRDPTINGHVGRVDTTFACLPNKIVYGGTGYAFDRSGFTRTLTNHFGDKLFSSYGRTYFVDTTSARSQLIRTPGECLQAANSLPRSPALPAN